MAKKGGATIKAFKHNGLSQLMIALTVILIILGSFEAATQNDITNIAPTQIFLVAGVLGILGLYLKDDN